MLTPEHLTATHRRKTYLILTEHTLDQLRNLRLDGMLRAIEEQSTSTAAATLSFAERLTLLVQREIAWRDDRRV